MCPNILAWHVMATETCTAQVFEFVQKLSRPFEKKLVNTVKGELSISQIFCEYPVADE